MWGGALLALLIAEFVVIHLQIKRNMYGVTFFKFYGNPLMITLPFFAGLSACRRFKRKAALRSINDMEYLSRDFGYLTVLFYCTLSSALLWFS